MKLPSSLSLRVFYLIAAVVFIIFLFYQRNFRGYEYIHSDGYSYYVFLPATFIYHDLTMKYVQDLPVELRAKTWVADYPGKDYKISKMTSGVAMLMSPFFLAGHAIALLTGEPAHGYSRPYQVMISFAAIVYFLAGLYFIRKSLLHYFSEKLTTLALLIPFFATNLMNYVLWEPAMSHVYSFFLVSMLVYFSIRWHREFKSRHFFIILFTLGMITLIRPTNVLVGLFPLLFGMNDRELWKRKFSELFRRPLLLVPGVIIFLFPVSLQLLLWKYQTGSWAIDSYAGEHFFFNQPHIAGVLLGFRSGWLIYTPVMIFALVGFYFMFKRKYTFSWSVVLFFLINLYIASSWWCYWYGGAFGMRPFIDFYALFLLPLTATLKELFERKITRILTVLAIASLCVLNAFQQYQYQEGIIHYAYMSPRSYAAVFGKTTKPENFESLLEPDDWEMASQGKPMRRFFRPENLGKKIEKEEFIALRASNGKFVSADAGYEWKVIVNRDTALAWETFRIIYVDGKCVLKTWDDRWLCHDADGFQKMNKYPSEDFVVYTLHPLGDDRVAIEAGNGRYLAVTEKDGHPFLTASEEKISIRSTFQLSRPRK